MRNIAITTTASLILLSSIEISIAAGINPSGPAIVPSADLIGMVDIQALNATEVARKKEQELENSTNPLTAPFEVQREKIERITGLTKDDIIGAVFSCDFDTINLQASTARDRTAAMNGAAALLLAKPITMAKIKQAIDVSGDTQNKELVKDLIIAGQPALCVKAKDPKDPDFYMLALPSMKTVLMALNQASLTEAVKRAGSGKSVSEPKDLTQLRKVLPLSSQVQIACVVPESVRTSIAAQINTMTQQSNQQPGMAAFVGFFRLFQGLRNFAIGFQADSDSVVSVAGDLGSSEAANQAGVLLENMIIPMMQSMIAQNAGQQGGAPMNLANQATVKVDNSSLRISFVIPETENTAAQ